MKECISCGELIGDNVRGRCPVCFGLATKEDDIANKEENIANNIKESDVIVYSIEGVRGRSIVVYPNRCVIKTKAKVSSFITGNASDGEKTIYYVDCIGVQFKKSGLQIGYLQLETASSFGNNKHSNFFNENTFTFDASISSATSNEKMEEVAEYIKGKIDEIKTKPQQQVVSNISAADEILKFKELLDLGIITQEEFDVKKKQLLGL